MDLSKRPFQPHIDYHGLYVALSRVKQSKHLRVLPLQPMQTGFDYLFNLKPPVALTNWIQAYDKDGKWIVQQNSTLDSTSKRIAEKRKSSSEPRKENKRKKNS